VGRPLPRRRRHISPLRLHDLRHSFAFALAAATGSDAYELERLLGHQFQRYTNPPEDIADSYVKQM
jgi:integrase